MKISIVGLGFVGSVIYKVLTEKKYQVDGYDKYKNGGIGKLKYCLTSDITFLCLPTLYDEETKGYDMSPINETLEYLNKNNYQNLIVLKSTVLPNVTEELAIKYNLNIVNNPEFLTARTAYFDFLNQNHIVLGKTSVCSQEQLKKIYYLYKKNWPCTKISLVSSTESEIMKLSCNCFYAIKVQFFNEMYLLCKNRDIDYNQVKNLMICNGWINPMHTQVPGPDGKLSYGGLCFPKDTKALNNYMKYLNIPNQVLTSTINERDMMRNDNINCKINQIN